jgi:hypothetical protein
MGGRNSNLKAQSNEIDQIDKADVITQTLENILTGQLMDLKIGL